MGETGRPSVREVEGPVSVRGLELPGAEGGTLVVEWAEGREEALDLRLETCHSPLCGCATVRLICTARGEPGRERVASLDLRGRCVADSEDGGVEDTAFAEVVASTLTDEQWDELWRHLLEMKRAAEERGDLDALELELPDEVATESLMIGYQDVFPFAEMLELTADGRHWAVTDDYCVQPRCSCTEVVLAFFPLPERRPRPGDAGDEPCAVAAAVRYDVARRRWRLEDDPPASSSAVRALMAALEAAVPDLAKVLVERRRRLRRLSARWFARQVPAPVEAAPRVGRNEPCPCGSGRKYKHCCGR